MDKNLMFSQRKVLVIIIIKMCDKIVFVFTCEIDLEERKNGLKRLKYPFFCANIYSYGRNYICYERYYVC